MAQIEKILDKLKSNATNVSFAELAKICGHYFGEPRIQGSHYVYKMPWAGDPRINIQDKNGKAKAYQVKQVLNAIEKFEKKEDG